MKLLPIFTMLLFMLSNLPILCSQENTSFFEPLQINEIRLKTESANWQYILDSFHLNDNSFLTADLEYQIGENPKKYELKNIGFRYQSYRGFTPGDKFNALEIKINHKVSNQNIEKHQSLQLSQALRDPSMLREVLGYSIWRTFAPAPRANFAKVFVNDQFYGLMVNIEPIDEAFLTSYFGSSKGTLYKSNASAETLPSTGCKKNIFGTLLEDASSNCYQDHFINYTNKNWDNLFQLSKFLNQQPDKIAQMLDIDQTLWMLALNHTMVNLYSYSGMGSPNYYLYQDEKNIFHPIVGSLNLGFGIYKNIGEGSDLPIQDLERLDPLLHVYNVEKPLVNQILKDDLHRKTYLAHVRTITEQFFWNERFNRQADSLHQLIRPILANSGYDMTRFDESLNTTTGTKNFVPGLVSFMEERARFLKKHPSLTVLPSQIQSVEVTKRAAYSSQKLNYFEIKANIDRYPRTVKLYYRFNQDSPYQVALMNNNGLDGDETENDDIFTIKITPPTGIMNINYYIFVENAGAVSFAPYDYMYHSFSASLEELNR